MQYLVILSKIPNETVGLIIGLFFGIIFVIYGIDQIFKNLNASKIIPPTETLKLEHLSEGITIIVLDTKGTFPVIQTVQSYQADMKTNIFKNTFFFDGEGKYVLERLKTYEVVSTGKEGTKTLNQVYLLITADSIVG